MRRAVMVLRQHYDMRCAMRRRRSLAFRDASAAKSGAQCPRAPITRVRVIGHADTVVQSPKTLMLLAFIVRPRHIEYRS